jgi:hypothetical protein
MTTTSPLIIWLLFWLLPIIHIKAYTLIFEQGPGIVVRVTRAGGTRVARGLLLARVVGFLIWLVVRLVCLLQGFLHLGSWGIFARDFGVTFPETGIDALGEFMELDEGIWLSDVGDLILDLGWESDVELSLESGLAPLNFQS